MAIIFFCSWQIRVNGIRLYRNWSPIKLWLYKSSNQPENENDNGQLSSNFSMNWLKAYTSDEILNWHSLSVSADICIHFYCLSRLKQASQRKMIQSSALRLRLWLCQFKISSDNPAFRALTQKSLFSFLWNYKKIGK